MDGAAHSISADDGVVAGVSVTHSLRLVATPQRVWRALTDFTATPDWQPAVIEERCEPSGAPAVGARIFQRRRFMGRTITGWSTIAAFDPPNRMFNRGEGVRISYLLQPADGGDSTDLTFTITLTEIPALLHPLVRRQLRRDVVGRFRRLQALLDAGRWSDPA